VRRPDHRRAPICGLPCVPQIQQAQIRLRVAGYVSIAWLLRYLATHTLSIFVVFRIALGVLVLALAAISSIS
jgi:undecaprenyl-diphosphatase